MYQIFVLHLRWLKHTSVILFLNKQDLLEKKISEGRFKLETYFPDFSTYQLPSSVCGAYRMCVILVLWCTTVQLLTSVHAAVQYTCTVTLYRFTTLYMYFSTVHSDPVQIYHLIHVLQYSTQ